MRKPKSRGGPPEDALPVSKEEVSDNKEIGQAEILRLCYDRERSEWESVRKDKDVSYHSPAVYKGKDELRLEGGIVVEKARRSVWLNLVRFFAERKIQGTAYIVMQFSLMRPAERIPEPGQLTAEKYIARWEAGSERLDARLRLALDTQGALAQTHFMCRKYLGDKPEDAWETVLTNDALELSALFRYCTARLLGGPRFLKIATLFEPGAVMQYQRFRASYRKRWRAILPKDFHRRARRLYPILLGAGNARKT